MFRDAHLEPFDKMAGLLARMSRTVVTAVRHANTALLDVDADVGEVESTVAAARTVSALRREADNLVPVLLARQHPVASDLRLVLGGLRMSADMDRMGRLAEHIAEVARARQPEPAVPAPARQIVSAMAEVAASLAEKSSLVLATREPIAAMQLDLDDDVTDALMRRLFAMLTGDWGHGTQAAVDVATVGRYYERIADHAVSVGRQVAYLVTGNVIKGRP